MRQHFGVSSVTAMSFIITGLLPLAGEEPKPVVSGLVRVVSEGVGDSSDAAVKDAFRNAVRQVVGAVVDAETLVKNDKLVEDSVLTYSDGFIKSYEVLPNSEKKQAGLFRVRIVAVVERRSLIAKLNTASVTMKEVDGKGLFAEAVTQLEAEKNASALMEKALADFPKNCLKPEIVGKPSIIAKKDDRVTLRIVMRFQADNEAYRLFTEKMTRTLGALSKERGDFTVVLKPYTVTAETPLGDRLSLFIPDAENKIHWFERAPEWIPK